MKMIRILFMFALVFAMGNAFGQIKVVTTGQTHIGAGIGTPAAQVQINGNMAINSPATGSNSDIRNHKIFGIDDSKRIQISTNVDTRTSSAYFQMFGDETNPAGQAARVGEFVCAGSKFFVRTGNDNDSFGTINFCIDADGNQSLTGNNSSSSFRLISNDDDDAQERASSFEYGLKEVLQMNAKKSTSVNKSNETVQTVGVSAKEIANIAPSIVSSFEINDYEKNVFKTYETVDMSAITFMLVNSIKEQQQVINELQARIVELENK